jgi:hypothetical protein
MIKNNADRRTGDCGELIMGQLLKAPQLTALAFVCLLLAAGTSFAQSAAPDTAMDSLPKLSDRAGGGSIRCPDGSTRPFSGASPSDLTVSMLCDVPANVAAAREAQANTAVEAKNADAQQQAALAGQSGVTAGLKATAKTGRLDYLLAQPWIWFVGIVLAIFALGAVVGTIRKRL